MSAQPHELLNISLKQLKEQNDAFIAAQYDAAVAEACKKAATTAQLLALEHAFEALQTSKNRAKYVAALEKAPTAAGKKPNASEDSFVYVVTAKNAPALKAAYVKFVTENYKNEPDKASFRPEPHSFQNLEAFQNHTLFRKISAEDRANIIKAGFPCEILALPFKNKADADKFRNNMMAEGLIQRNQPHSSPRMAR